MPTISTSSVPAAGVTLTGTAKSTCIAKPDAPAVKSVARVSHSLKSSAATLGLMRLAAACRALEMEIRNTTGSEETPTLTAAVFDRFEESVPILRRLL